MDKLQFGNSRLTAILLSLLIVLACCMGAPSTNTNSLTKRQMTGGPDIRTGQIIIGLNHAFNTIAGQQDITCLQKGFMQYGIYPEFVMTIPFLSGVVYNGIEEWSGIITTFTCVKFVAPNYLIGYGDNNSGLA
ncbi:hypothetical protein BJ085DRAFT_28241 [Dimargaris cristalligena]|uniref:Uncharacterized protein n=1 Tax=Dimargaris cristalligena TaxID=215637 RepID=A0A4V1J4G3_9FUNG|nr:hypothetical protein BJ085DRAFT_28241 [Dimargaris cristalligena]|eukprot:RKP35459.1 hypothetical protein BJ085DRAFT_28241 [Dimargaris cristalligena]